MARTCSSTARTRWSSPSSPRRRSRSTRRASRSHCERSRNQEGFDGMMRLAILDRPRRHVHRHRRRARPDGALRHAQAAVREPRALPRRGGRRHPRTCSGSRPASRSRPAQIEAVKMGTTVATNALLERKGEPHGAGRSPRLRRRAAHRLPEPAATSSTGTSCCRELLYERGGRGRRARRRRRRRSCSRSTGRAARRRPASARYDDGYRARRDRLHARLPLSRRTSARSPSIAREVGFTQVSVIARGQPADEAGRPRRHHGGRRLPVADPAPLRRPGRGRAAGRAAAVHAVATAGSTDARALPGQGRDPVRPGRRHRRHGAHVAARPASTGSSASTWAAPRPTSSHYAGEFEREFETAGRRRAHARADDEHPHRRGRRRLDLHFDGARYRVGPGLRRRRTRARPATAAAGR